MQGAGEGTCIYQLSKVLCSITCASKIYVFTTLMDATPLKPSNVYNIYYGSHTSGLQVHIMINFYVQMCIKYMYQETDDQSNYLYTVESIYKSHPLLLTIATNNSNIITVATVCCKTIMAEVNKS